MGYRRYSYISLIFLLVFASANTFAQRTLVIATIDKYPGVDAVESVMREAYRQLGVSLVIKKYTGNASLLASSAGEVDGELVRFGMIAEQYPSLIQIPVPLLQVESIAYSNEWDFDVEGWESLEPYHVGILKGAVYAELGTRGYKRTIFSATKRGFDALASKKIDIFVTTKINGMFALNSSDAYRDIRALESPLFQMPVFHFLHEKNQQLVPEITEVLFNMQNNGTLDRMMQSTITSETN